jgi:hypothetical protein
VDTSERRAPFRANSRQTGNYPSVLRFLLRVGVKANRNQVRLPRLNPSLVTLLAQHDLNAALQTLEWVEIKSRGHTGILPRPRAAVGAGHDRGAVHGVARQAPGRIEVEVPLSSGLPAALRRILRTCGTWRSLYGCNAFSSATESDRKRDGHKVGPHMKLRQCVRNGSNPTFRPAAKAQTPPAGLKTGSGHCTDAMLRGVVP